MRNAGRRVAVVGGNRTPFARASGAYAQASTSGPAHRRARRPRRPVLRCRASGSARWPPVRCCRHSRDVNLTREAVLGSALSPLTPAYDVAQACGTGLEATVLVGAKIALGQVDVGIAGGVDSASDAPVVVDEGLRRVLLDLNRARTPARPAGRAGAPAPRAAAPGSCRASSSRAPGCRWASTRRVTAAEWGIGRREQDELALASHQRLAAAYERGFFDDLLTPYLGLRARRPRCAPTPPREARRAASRCSLAPGGAEATMTAGNSTPLSDGAGDGAAGHSDEWAAERGLPVLAHLVDAETAAVDHVRGGEGCSRRPRRPCRGCCSATA